jgi:hypothetical protein
MLGPPDHLEGERYVEGGRSKMEDKVRERVCGWWEKTAHEILVGLLVGTPYPAPMVG